MPLTLHALLSQGTIVGAQYTSAEDEWQTSP